MKQFADNEILYVFESPRERVVKHHQNQSAFQYKADHAPANTIHRHVLYLQTGNLKSVHACEQRPAWLQAGSFRP